MWLTNPTARSSSSERITVHTAAISEETEFAVARFNVDGTPDIAFGRKWDRSHTGERRQYLLRQAVVSPTRLTIGDDGRIVVVGAAMRRSGSITTKYMAAVARV
jgi:hypothetical protein